MKLEELKKEIRKAELDILGFSEIRSKNKDDFMSDEFRIITSGEDGTRLEDKEKIKIDMKGHPNTRNEFNAALENLKEKKATGIDDIPTKTQKI